VPRLLRAATVSVALLATPLTGQQSSTTTPSRQTHVVLLGTGDPAADPDQSGPATAVVVNDTPYLVDFGAGVVRRAKAAAIDRGIKALEPTNLRVAFVTHLPRLILKRLRRRNYSVNCPRDTRDTSL
jgi:hypothetical protein